jgi:hypothetical protein
LGFAADFMDDFAVFDGYIHFFPVNLVDGVKDEAVFYE